MNITPGTLARMAGNIAAGLVAPKRMYGSELQADYTTPVDLVAGRAIDIAEAIAKRLDLTVAQDAPKP